LREILRCPGCLSRLEWRPLQRFADPWGVVGVLFCRHAACGAWYPVTGGIPRLLTGAMGHELRRIFLAEHPDAVPELALRIPTDADPDVRASTRLRTSEMFGFEWSEYSRFGWDDAVYNIAREEKVFRRKSLFRPDDLRGRLVIDAGCGNGRYAYWAAHYGARVVGVDLGGAVEAAAMNTRDLESVAVVQADLFHLPFSARTFDAAFSIGVLMHTGDASSAFSHLCSVVRLGGSVSVHVYGRGNPIYEFLDARLRKLTTSMSIPELRSFVDRLFRIRRTLDRFHLSRVVERFVRIDQHPHCIFDWYGAPEATHHTSGEVIGWFRDEAVTVTASNESASRVLPHWLEIVRPYVHGPGSVTVRGVVTRDIVAAE
jgi:SAM-dependent methyltransferase/uncharacterized protein YbaR (Trm112 family)